MEGTCDDIVEVEKSREVIPAIGSRATGRAMSSVLPGMCDCARRCDSALADLSCIGPLVESSGLVEVSSLNDIADDALA